MATSAIDSVTVQANEAGAPPGEWSVLKVIAKGDQVTVRVNGAIVPTNSACGS